MSNEEHTTRTIIAAFLANLGIAIMKFVGFAFTRSGSMLAEAVHSVADTGNELLLLFGGRTAKRDPDPDHPFGYGRERFFWAFVVSVLLFSVGGVFSIADGIEKLVNPHEIESVVWAYVILGGSVVLEAFSFRTAIRESRPVKGNSTWWQFIRRAKNPELPVVVLEDFAALIGLSTALIAITLATLTGETKYDAFGSILIGLLLCVIAVVLAIEMRSLLIGEAAEPEVERRIAQLILDDARVHRLINLRTEHIGPEELLVAAKLEFAPDLSMRELADVVDDVEAAVRASVPQATLMFLEPDVMRPRSAHNT